MLSNDGLSPNDGVGEFVRSWSRGVVGAGVGGVVGVGVAGGGVVAVPFLFFRS